MAPANLRPQINATFDHPQNIVFVHLLEIVSNCMRLYTEVIDVSGARLII